MDLNLKLLQSLSEEQEDKLRFDQSNLLRQSLKNAGWIECSDGHMCSWFRFGVATTKGFRVVDLAQGIYSELAHGTFMCEEPFYLPSQASGFFEKHELNEQDGMVDGRWPVAFYTTFGLCNETVHIEDWNEPKKVRVFEPLGKDQDEPLEAVFMNGPDYKLLESQMERGEHKTLAEAMWWAHQKLYMGI